MKRLICFILSSFFAIAINAQQFVDLLPIAASSGAVNTMTTIGNRLYVGAGRELLVLNITDLDQPKLETTILLSDQIRGIAYQNDFAYVALGESGSQIIDLTNPDLPQLRAKIPTTEFVSDLLIKNDLLVTANGYAGLQLIYVTNPHNPIEVATIPTRGRAIHLDLYSDLLYVVSTELTNAAVQVFDISQPLSPIELASQIIPMGQAVDVGDIRTNDSHIFIASRAGGLKILNRNDLSEVEHDLTFFDAAHLDLLENRLFVVDLNFGAKVVDVTNSETISLIGQYQTAQRCPAISRSYANDTFFIANGKSHIEFLRIAPVPIDQNFDINAYGTFHTFGQARSVAVADDAILIANDDGLTIAKILTPLIDQVFDEPQIFQRTNGIAERIQIIDQNIGVLIDQEVTFFDLLNLDQPTVITKYLSDGPTHGIAKKGNFGYLLNDANGIELIDLTDPNQPTQIAIFQTNGRAYDLAIRDELGYLANGDGGFRILDLADPTNPRMLGQIPVSAFQTDQSSTGGNGFALRVAVIDDLAFVAGGFAGVPIIDVHFPNAPKLLTTINTDSFARDVIVDPPLIFIADTNGGVRVVNFSDLANPIEIAHSDGIAFDLAKRPIDADKFQIVVAADQNGITLFEPQILDQPSPIITKIDQRAGLAFGGVDVEVSGRNFQSDSKVFLGEMEVTEVELITADLIRFKTPETPDGIYDLIVENLDAQTARFPNAYNAIPIQPKLRISPNQINYGEIFLGTEDQFINEVTVTNAGTADLELFEILVPNLSFDLSPLQIPPIAPDESVTLTLEFTPSAIAVIDEVITIESNDARSPHTLSLGAIVRGASATFTVSGFGQHQTENRGGTIIESAEVQDGYEVHISNISNALSLIITTQNGSYSVTFTDPPEGHDSVVTIGNEIFVQVFLGGIPIGQANKVVTEVELLNRAIEIDFAIPFPDPTITSVIRINDDGTVTEPANGGGDTLIEIRGTNFRDGLELRIGNDIISDNDLISESQLRVRTPLGIPGDRDIFITNIDDKQVRFRNAYTYNSISEIRIDGEDRVVMKVGDADLFKVLGFDENGFPLTIPGTVSWEIVIGETIGILAKTGSFLAQSVGTMDALAVYNDRTLGRITAPLEIIVLAGETSKISLHAEPPTLTADPRSNTKIIAKVTDRAENPVLDEEVTFSAINGTFSPVLSGGNGEYITTFTPSSETLVGDLQIRGETRNGKLSVVTLDLRAPVARLKIDAEQTQLVADGHAKTKIEITALDAQGRTTPEKAITVSTNIGELSEVIDEGNGVYSTEYLANTTIAGTVQIIAEAEFGITQPITLNLTGGDATQISLRTSENNLPADAKSKSLLRMQLIDTYGNPVVNQRIDFEIESNMPDRSGKVINQIDLGGGSYTADYVAGTAVGTVKIRAIAGAVIDETEIQLTLGDTARFSLSVISETKIADGKTPIELLLHVSDPYKNTIPNLHVNVRPSRGTIENLTEIGDGKYQINYIPTTSADPVEFVATVTDGKNTIVSPPIIFSPDPTDPSGLRSTLELEIDSDGFMIAPPADGVESVLTTVTIRDEYQNLVQNVTATISSDTIEIDIIQAITDADGKAIFRLRSKTTGRQEVRVHLAEFPGFQFSETVRFSSPFVDTVQFTDLPESVSGDGTTQSILFFTVANNEDHLISTAQIALSTNKKGSELTFGEIASPAESLGNGLYRTTFTAPTIAGVAQIFAKVEDEMHTPPQGATRSAEIQILPGDLSPELSTVEIFPTQILANGKEFTTVTITLADRQYAKIPNRKIRVSGIGDGIEVTQPIELTNADGQTTAEVRISSAGQKTIFAEDITHEDSPRSILAQPILTAIPPTPTEIRISSESASLPANGVSQTPIKIEVLDAAGDRIDGGIVTLTATAGIVTEIAQQLESGLYSTIYTVPNVPQTVKITAKTDDGLTAETEIVIDRIDFTEPTFIAKTISRTSIEIEFDEPVIGGSPENWSVNGLPISDFQRVSELKANLILQLPINTGDTPIVRYSPTEDSEITDTSGNPIKKGRSLVVAIDGIRPTYQARISGGKTIEVTFSEKIVAEEDDTGWSVEVDRQIITIKIFSQLDKKGKVWQIELDTNDPNRLAGESAELRYLQQFGDLKDKSENPPSADPITALSNSAPILKLIDATDNILTEEKIEIELIEGSGVELIVSGSDTETENLTFTLKLNADDQREMEDGSIAFERLETNRHRFTYRPDFEVATAIKKGFRRFTFSVTDDSFVVHKTVEITISNISQAASIKIEMIPPTVRAELGLEASIFATIFDSEGDLVFDEAPIATYRNQIETMPHTGEGVYLATYRPNEVVGVFTVTVTASNDVSSAVEVTHVGGEAASITLLAEITELPADSISITKLISSVRDSKNRPVGSAKIIFENPIVGTISEVSRLSTGKFVATYTTGSFPEDAIDPVHIETITANVEETNLSATVDLTLKKLNTPPTLEIQTLDGETLIEPILLTASEGEAIDLQLSAIDPDGDELRFSAENLPPLARLDAFGKFQWHIPHSAATGIEKTRTYQILFFATDHLGGAVSEEIEIEIVHVSNASRLRIFASPDRLKVNELTTVTIMLMDRNNVRVEGDTIFITTSRGDAIDVIESGNGIYTATINAGEKSGEIDLIATVSDTTIAASTTISVQPDSLAEIQIEPKVVNVLRAGEAQIFTAIGKDQFDNPIELSTQSESRWEIEGEIGGISNSGVFIATTVGNGKINFHYGEMIASVDVVVSAGSMTKIVINDAITEISIDETPIFSIRAFDNFENEIMLNPSQVIWSIDSELGDFDGNVLLPKALGVGTLRAAFSDFSDDRQVKIIGGALQKIEIVEEKTELIAGEIVIFRAIGRDELGNVVKIPNAAIWEFIGDPIGTINRNQRSDVEAISITAKKVGSAKLQLIFGGVIGVSSQITVQPSRIVKLQIEPKNVAIIAGQTQTFTLHALDAFENVIDLPADLPLSWEVIGEIGRFRSAMALNPVLISRRSGVGQVKVSTLIDGEIFVQHSGQVTVQPADLSKIIIIPSEIAETLTVGDGFQFGAIGFDLEGNEIELSNPEWSVKGGIGEIDPSGKFASTKEGFGIVQLDYGGLSVATSEIFASDLVTLTIGSAGGGRGTEISFPFTIAPVNPEFGNLFMRFDLTFPIDLLTYVKFHSPKATNLAEELDGNRSEILIEMSPAFLGNDGLLMGELIFKVSETARDLVSGEIEIGEVQLIQARRERPLKFAKTARFTVLPDVELSLEPIEDQEGEFAVLPGEMSELNVILKKPNLPLSRLLISIESEPEIVFVDVVLPENLKELVKFQGAKNRLQFFAETDLPLDFGRNEFAKIKFGIDPKAKLNQKRIIVIGGEISPQTRGGYDPHFNFSVSAEPFSILVGDNKPPIGTLKINSGENHTNTTDVLLEISATDLGMGIFGMRVKNDEDFTEQDNENIIPWIDFAETLEWKLSDDDGEKRIYLQIADRAGNIVETSISDRIILDRTPPIGSIYLISESPTSFSRVEIAVAADDNVTDMDANGEFRVRNDDANFENEKWNRFNPDADRDLITWSEWNLSAGEEEKQIFVQFRDEAGNLSSPFSTSVFVDVRPPQPIQFQPNQDLIDLPIDAHISVTFDEPITIDPDRDFFSVSTDDGANRYDGEVIVSEKRIDFRIDGHFGNLEKITVKIDRGILDLLGNSTREISWSFTTGIGVFPGDTNNDGEVNGLDIVPIGRFWKVTGQPRQNASTLWQIQSAVPFDPSDATFADSDGNGIINADDIIPIAINWNRRTSDQDKSPPKLTKIEEFDFDLSPEICGLLRDRLQFLGSHPLIDFLERLIGSPTETALFPNFPNPFNPETWLPFQTDRDGEISLTIFDQTGKLVRRLEIGFRRSGFYTDQNSAIHWDGKNEHGESVASGIYFCRFELRSDQKIVSEKWRKLTLIK